VKVIVAMPKDSDKVKGDIQFAYHETESTPRFHIHELRRSSTDKMEIEVRTPSGESICLIHQEGPLLSDGQYESCKTEELGDFKLFIRSTSQQGFFSQEREDWEETIPGILGGGLSIQRTLSPAA